MQLAIITPRKYYHLMNYSDMLFLLAPILNQEMIRWCAVNPKWKILDNGVWENNLVSNETFIRLIDECKVNEVIIPDEIFDAQTTISLAKEFLETYKNKNVHFMGVPHGKNHFEFIECYKFFKRLAEEQQIHCIGLSVKESRPNIWNYLVLHNQLAKCPHHFLGCHELISLSCYRSLNLVRSLDTSMPITFAYHGMRMHLFGHGKTRVPLEQDIELDENLAIENINYMKRFVNALGANCTPLWV